MLIFTAYWFTLGNWGILGTFALKQKIVIFLYIFDFLVVKYYGGERSIVPSR